MFSEEQLLGLNSTPGLSERVATVTKLGCTDFNSFVICLHKSETPQ